MANPAGHVVLGEEEAQQAAEGYAKMEAELQALRQRNEELDAHCTGATRFSSEQKECGRIAVQELRRRNLQI